MIRSNTIATPLRKKRAEQYCLDPVSSAYEAGLVAYMETFNQIYRPLIWTAQRSEPFANCLNWYLDLWMPLVLNFPANRP